jgi:MFS family permease
MPGTRPGMTEKAARDFSSTDFTTKPRVWRRLPNSVHSTLHGKKQQEGQGPERSQEIVPCSNVTDLVTPSALAPFRIRNYRFQWPADLLTSWAFEMEAISLGWYVLVTTGSVLALTVLVSLNYVGTLAAPLFGVFGDRVGHRNLLVGMRVVYAANAIAMTTLTLSGLLTPTYLFILASILGFVRPSDLGVRGALVAHIMPLQHLTTAMSVSRTTMDTARLAGALAGTGLFATVGMGRAYVAISCLYVIATLLTLGIASGAAARPGATADGPLPSPLQDLKEGIVYTWKMPRMQAVMWIAFFTNFTAYPITNGLLPYAAKSIFGTDETGLGTMAASYAIGSLTASIMLSIMSAHKLGRLVVCCTLIWYVMLLLYAQTTSFNVAIALLTLIGFAQSFAMIGVAVILLRTASEHMRGRVMGVRMMVIYGLPIGLLIAGSLIEKIGFAASASLYAALGVVFMLAVAIRWRGDLWDANAPANTG